MFRPGKDLLAHSKRFKRDHVDLQAHRRHSELYLRPRFLAYKLPKQLAQPLYLLGALKQKGILDFNEDSGNGRLLKCPINNERVVYGDYLTRNRLTGFQIYAPVGINRRMKRSWSYG